MDDLDEMPPLENVKDTDVEMTSETQHGQADVEENWCDSDSMGTTLCLDDFHDSGHQDDYESDDGACSDTRVDESSDSDVSSELPVSDREDFEDYNPCGPRPSQRSSQEVVNMCLALMQHLQDNSPDIMK